MKQKQKNMSGEEYSQTQELNTREPMILRDYLAVDRTIMANETSFLAYIRTALTLVVVGASLLKFFSSTGTHILGWVFIVLALLIMVHGAIQYKEMDEFLQKLTGRLEQEQAKQHLPYTKKFLTAGQIILGLFR